MKDVLGRGGDIGTSDVTFVDIGVDNALASCESTTPAVAIPMHRELQTAMLCQVRYIIIVAGSETKSLVDLQQEQSLDGGDDDRVRVRK